MDLNERGKCETATEAKPDSPTNAELVKAIIEAISHLEKEMYSRFEELSRRLRPIEEAREREFQAEAGRRLGLDKKGDYGPCDTQACGPSLSHRLRKFL